MRNFIKQLFNFSFLQLAVIVLLGGLQFLANTYAIGVPDKVKAAIVIAALALLIIAAGIAGIIANLEGSYEAWEERSLSSPKHRYLGLFIQGSYIIAFGSIFLLNVLISHASPAVSMLLIVAFLMLRNGILYFKDTIT